MSNDTLMLPPARTRSNRVWVVAGAVLALVVLALWFVVDARSDTKSAHQAAAVAASEKAAADKANAERIRLMEEKIAKQEQTAREKKIAEDAAAKAKREAEQKAATQAARERAAAKAKLRNVQLKAGPSNATFYGSFRLTSRAKPGPIHSYQLPSDKSKKLYPIFSYEYVSVYCSVRGQSIDGHDYWDWTGYGYVWDRMIDIGGTTPPPCEFD